METADLMHVQRKDIRKRGPETKTQEGRERGREGGRERGTCLCALSKPFNFVLVRALDGGIDKDWQRESTSHRLGPEKGLVIQNTLGVRQGWRWSLSCRTLVTSYFR
eukprot:186989-Rhodomonas_salina.1